MYKDLDCLNIACSRFMRGYGPSFLTNHNKDLLSATLSRTPAECFGFQGFRAYNSIQLYGFIIAVLNKGSFIDKPRKFAVAVSLQPTPQEYSTEPKIIESALWDFETVSVERLSRAFDRSYMALLGYILGRLDKDV